MLTPTYSSTATERVLPRLALDFTTGVLDSRVTVTRALNTATRTNSSGLIETVNANLPRFDYDPVTLAPRGLLIEETRANVVTYSQQFNDASWIKINSATVTADAVVSPDGATNADTITLAGGYGGVYKTTVIALGTVTASCYFKASTANAGVTLGITDNSVDYACRINVSTGAIQFTSAGLASATVTSVGNGWYRVVITRALVAANPNIFTTIPSGSSGNAYYAWGAQLEAGAFATSYIPTTTTSLTRNADVVTMTGANFSSWYNVGAGSWYIQTNARNATTILTAGTFSLAATATALKKYANSYASDQSATSLVLGQGTVAKVSYYKQALIPAELAALTN